MRKGIKYTVPPVLHIKSNKPMSAQKLEEFRASWIKACEEGKPIVIASPLDTEVRFISVVSPKRNRFLNYRKQ